MRPKVAKLRRNEDVDGLCAAADYRTEFDDGADVRLAACRALAEVDDPRSTEAQVRLTQDENGAVRMAAVAALAGQDRPEAVEALARVALTGDEIELRDAGLAGLMRAEQRAEPAVRVFVAQPERADAYAENVMQQVLDGEPPRERRRLLSMTLDADDPAFNAAFLFGAFPTDGRRELFAGLKDPGRQGRSVALLGEARDTMATGPLVELLSSGDAETRVAAAGALGRIQDPRSAAALMSAEEDEDPRVRAAAGTALAASGLAASWGWASVQTSAAVAEPVRMLLRAGGAVAEPPADTWDPASVAPAAAGPPLRAVRDVGPPPVVLASVAAPAEAIQPPRGTSSGRRRWVVGPVAALVAAGVTTAIVVSGNHSDTVRPQSVAAKPPAAATPGASATPVATPTVDVVAPRRAGRRIGFSGQATVVRRGTRRTGLTAGVLARKQGSIVQPPAPVVAAPPVRVVRAPAAPTTSQPVVRPTATQPPAPVKTASPKPKPTPKPVQTISSSG